MLFALMKVKTSEWYETFALQVLIFVVRLRLSYQMHLVGGSRRPYSMVIESIWMLTLPKRYTIPRKPHV